MVRIDLAKLAKKDETYKTHREYKLEGARHFIGAFGIGVKTKQELTDFLFDLNLIEKEEDVESAIKQLGYYYKFDGKHRLIEVENCDGIGYKIYNLPG